MEDLISFLIRYILIIVAALAIGSAILYFVIKNGIANGLLKAYQAIETWKEVEELNSRTKGHRRPPQEAKADEGLPRR